jgi:uncharacterized protein with GYD domain
MLFLQISKHSIESCPLHNDKVKKVYVDSFAKMGQLMQKHGIKLVGGWTGVLDHLFVAVCEAPSMDALMRFSMEPEPMSWFEYNSTQILPVMSMEEGMKLLNR